MNLFPCASRPILSRPSVFTSAALMLLLFAIMADAEDDNNNINSTHRETIRSGDNKADGLGVHFPGYYSLELLELLPVDLPKKEAAAGATTSNPIDTVVGTTTKKSNPSRYPIDWTAVAEDYYRSIDMGSERRNPPPPPAQTPQDS